MASFFQATWLLWWLIAAVIIGRWCWLTFFIGGDGNERGHEPWRELYRTAMLETDGAKMKQSFEAAERAILLALAAGLFRLRDRDRVELRSALNNLRVLRETVGHSQGGSAAGSRCA